jgi:ApaG protein
MADTSEPLISSSPEQVRVSTTADYFADYSNADNACWRVTVRIRNDSPETVQLTSRHWIFTDSNGRTYHVEAQTVGGGRPGILPGEEFAYTTIVPLPTATGFLEGDYTAQSRRGDIVIPIKRSPLISVVATDEPRKREQGITQKDMKSILRRFEIFRKKTSRHGADEIDTSKIEGLSSAGRIKLEKLLLRELLTAPSEGKLDLTKIHPSLESVEIDDIFALMSDGRVKVLILKNILDGKLAVLKPRTVTTDAGNKEVERNEQSDHNVTNLFEQKVGGLTNITSATLPKKPQKLWNGVKGTGKSFKAELEKFISENYGPYISQKLLTRAYIFQHDRRLYRAIAAYETRFETIPFDIPSERDLLTRKFDTYFEGGLQAATRRDKHAISRKMHRDESVVNSGGAAAQAKSKPSRSTPHGTPSKRTGPHPK